VEDLRERDLLEDLAVDGRILKSTFKKWDELAWIGLVWLRIQSYGGLLGMR
jgi:hypothetical protein